MDTITVNTKEYRILKAAKARLDALFNVRPRKSVSLRTKRESFADLVGALGDVPELKGKTSVEVQHMIPALWHKKRSS